MTYKVVFAEQRAEGFEVREEPFVPLRLPKLYDLRADPFERADHESIGYSRWRFDRAFVFVPAQNTEDANTFWSFELLPLARCLPSAAVSLSRTLYKRGKRKREKARETIRKI